MKKLLVSAGFLAVFALLFVSNGLTELNASSVAAPLDSDHPKDSINVWAQKVDLERIIQESGHFIQEYQKEADENCILNQLAGGRVKSKAKGLGFKYKKINKRKPLSEQLIEQNTVYEIRSTIDLRGDAVDIPANSVLFFKRGRFINGNIKGNSTVVINKKEGTFDNVSVTGVICKGVVSLKENNFDNLLTIRADKYKIIDVFKKQHILKVKAPVALSFTEDTKITCEYQGVDNYMHYDDNKKSWVINKTGEFIVIEGNKSAYPELKIENLNVEKPVREGQDYYKNVLNLVSFRYVNLWLTGSSINGATRLGASCYQCDNVFIEKSRFENSWVCCYIKDCRRAFFVNNYVSQHFSKTEEYHTHHGHEGYNSTFYPRFFDGLAAYGGEENPGDITVVANIFEDCGQSLFYTSELKKALIKNNYFDKSFNFCVDLGAGTSRLPINSIRNITVIDNIMKNSNGFISLDRIDGAEIIGNKMVIDEKIDPCIKKVLSIAISNAKNVTIENNDITLMPFANFKGETVTPYYVYCSKAKVLIDNIVVRNHVRGNYQNSNASRVRIEEPEDRR